MKKLICGILLFIVHGLLPLGLFGADQEDSICVRGEPEPLYTMKSPGVKAHSFKKRSSHEAEEEITFKSGDKVRINNWGCEYFVNTFYYESKSIKGNNSDMTYWFKKSAEILKVLSRSNPNIVFDLEKAANTLEAKVINNKGLSFAHEPYPVEGDGIDFFSDASGC
jgi:hypothetical protein